MCMCAACGEFAGSSSYQKHGIWADLLATRKGSSLNGQAQ